MKTQTEQGRTPPLHYRDALRKLLVLFAVVSAAAFAWMAFAAP